MNTNEATYYVIHSYYVGVNADREPYMHEATILNAPPWSGCGDVVGEYWAHEPLGQGYATLDEARAACRVHCPHARGAAPDEWSQPTEVEVYRTNRWAEGEGA